MIPYGRQSIDKSDEAAVIETLRSDFLTQGPKVPKFEEMLREATGAAHAVACNSATSALHTACLALGLRPGDTLWTVPNTFVASANCGRLCGAEINFVDIDPGTLNMDPAALERKLEGTARAGGAMPKIVVPVDFAGLPCDIVRIRALAERFGFRIIEDASHAIGAKNETGFVGAGRLADVTVLSFHPVKIITTCEGGAALTEDQSLVDTMRLVRSHGITRDPAMMRGESEGPWYYQQIDLGLNYRMTDLHASLGCSQLRRLRDFVDRRTVLADQYDALLSDLPVIKAPRRSGAKSSWHLYVIQLDGKLAKQRRAVFERMRAADIGVNVHYIPVHLQPYYRDRGFNPGDFPNSEHYYQRTISLPLYAGLSDQDQMRVVDALRNSFA